MVNFFSSFQCITQLVGCQEEHLACKKLSDEVLAQLSVWSGVNDLHMLQLMSIPPHHLLLH